MIYSKTSQSAPNFKKSLDFISKENKPFDVNNSLPNFPSSNIISHDMDYWSKKRSKIDQESNSIEMSTSHNQTGKPDNKNATQKEKNQIKKSRTSFTDKIKKKKMK